MPRPKVPKTMQDKRLGGWQWGAVGLTVLSLWVLGCVAADSPRGEGKNYALQIRPAAEESQRLLWNAKYLTLMGRPQLALQELEEAYQRDSANLKVANALAESYDGLGQHERAQQIYAETLRGNADNRTLGNNLCYSHYLAGNWPKAEACFRETLARQPDNEAARNNLGLLLCRSGRQEEARRLWQEAEGEAGAVRKLDQVLTAFGLRGTGQQAPAATPGTSPVDGKPSGRQTPVVVAANSERQAAPAINPSAEPPRRKAERPESQAQPVITAAAPASGPAPRAQAELPGKANPVLEPRKVQAAPPVREAAVAAASAPRSQSASPARPEGPSLRQLPPGAEGVGRQASPILKPAGTGPGPKESERANPAVEATPPVATPSAAPAAATRMAPISAKDLMETKIELRNGNGIPDLAHEVRSKLHLEGYNVVSIANHVDFGMDQTTIYYRPGAEKMALVLQQKFFRDAVVKPASRLAAPLDIKVILGHDLSATPQSVASAQEAGKS